jgi:hypothetical protein
MIGKKNTSSLLLPVKLREVPAGMNMDTPAQQQYSSSNSA